MGTPPDMCGLLQHYFVCDVYLARLFVIGVFLAVIIINNIVIFLSVKTQFLIYLMLSFKIKSICESNVQQNTYEVQA